MYTVKAACGKPLSKLQVKNGVFLAFCSIFCPEVPMNCPNCNSDEISTIPAEIRLYRNAHRTLSHPPMNPSPDIHVCHECGWSQFAIPKRWMAAGWLNSNRPARQEVPAQSVFVPNLSVVN